MSWLFAAILAYFLFAIATLADKYLLSGRIPNPRIYAFYVGILGVSFLILLPVIGFFIPPLRILVLGLLSGALLVYALFWLYKALSMFEASRVVPAVGGLTPLFAMGIVYFLSSGREFFSLLQIFAFALLIIGAILITLKNLRDILSLKNLQISAFTAFLLAASLVFIKYVYLEMPFWNGFFWLRMGGVLTAVCFFLFTKEVREEVSKNNFKTIKFSKTSAIFILNQGVGGLGNILQNWAIFLAPLAFVAVIISLQGIQYVFLLIFAVLLSFKFPRIFKEEISRKLIFQKIIAILFIGMGMIILAFQ